MSKRKVGKIIALLVTVVLLLSVFAGCNSNRTAETDTGSAKETTKDSVTEKKLGNPVVSTLRFSDSPDESAWQEFVKKEYGIEEKEYRVDFMQRQVKLIALMASGEPVDVQWVTFEEYPIFMIKNVLQPLDDYTDINDPVYQPATTNNYVWKGKHYVLGSTVEPVGILFNKTMFENNGLKTPLEYYQEGTWNFENFKKAAIELTQDTNNDGTIDQYGYNSWMFQNFHIANGGKFVEFADDGSINLTWNDPKVLKGLDYVLDQYSVSKYIAPQVGTSFEDFWNGITAMFGERPMFLPTIQKKDSKFEADWVPFPLGPDNADGVQPGLMGGYGIGGGCKNPEGAGLWIYARVKYENEKDAAFTTAKGYSEDQVKRIGDASLKVVMDKYAGTGVDQWNFWGEFQGGQPIASTLAKWEPQWKAGIENTLKSTGVPTKLEPFTNIPDIDFESGDLQGLVALNDGVKVSADANEIIAGGNSLLFDIKAGSEWQTLAHTDFTKQKLPEYHIYEISFDYKIIDNPSGGSIVFTGRRGEIIAENKDNLIWFSIDGKKAGDTGNMTVTVAPADNAKDFSVLWMVSGEMKFTIDNLKIKEK